MTVSFLRHASFFSPFLNPPQLVILGCGATGSNIAMLAARMGFVEFQLWDADVVESHNLPNQVFDNCQIGTSKVLALEQKLKAFNPEIKVTVFNRFWYQDDALEYRPVLPGWLRPNGNS